MRTLILLAAFTLAGCKKDDPQSPTGPVKTEPVVAAPAKPSARRVEMTVTGDGFVPSNVTAKLGEPMTLVITRKTDETCATEILIEGTDINVPLPLDKPVEVAWTPAKSGKIKFGCAMDKMIGGLLLVD